MGGEISRRPLLSLEVFSYKYEVPLCPAKGKEHKGLLSLANLEGGNKSGLEQSLW